MVSYVEELVVLGIDKRRAGGRGAGRRRQEAAPFKAGCTGGGRRRRSAVQLRARKALEEAAHACRRACSAIVRFLPTALPRTATRKVKRRDVRRLLERNLAAERSKSQNGLHAGDGGTMGAAEHLATAAIAAVCRRAPSALKPEQSLKGELGYDSLMLLELLVTIEGQLGRPVDSERLSQCQTVGEVTELVREAGSLRAAVASAVIETEEKPPLKVPPVMRDAAKHWLGQAQMGFLANVMSRGAGSRVLFGEPHSLVSPITQPSDWLSSMLSRSAGQVSLVRRLLLRERPPGGAVSKIHELIPLSRTGSLRQSLRQSCDHSIKAGRAAVSGALARRCTQEFKPRRRTSLPRRDVYPSARCAHAAFPRAWSDSPRQLSCALVRRSSSRAQAFDGGLAQRGAHARRDTAHAPGHRRAVLWPSPRHAGAQPGAGSRVVAGRPGRGVPLPRFFGARRAIRAG